MASHPDFAAWSGDLPDDPSDVIARERAEADARHAEQRANHLRTHAKELAREIGPMSLSIYEARDVIYERLLRVYQEGQRDPR